MIVAINVRCLEAHIRFCFSVCLFSIEIDTSLNMVLYQSSLPQIYPQTQLKGGRIYLALWFEVMQYLMGKHRGGQIHNKSMWLLVM